MVELFDANLSNLSHLLQPLSGSSRFNQWQDSYSNFASLSHILTLTPINWIHVDPYFLRVFPLDSETHFYCENLIFFFYKKIRVATYFNLFFKKENKIRKKILCNSSFRKDMFVKSSLYSRVRLSIRKVQ